MKLPSQKWLKEHFEYVPGGFLRRLKFTGGAAKVGRVISGTDNGTGYRYLSLPGVRSVTIHRVIFKLVHGIEPKEIDHIDRNPRNNDIANLRSVTRSGNCHNGRMHSRNTSGIRGLSFHAARDCWVGALYVNGERHLCRDKNKQKAAEKLENLRKEKLKGIYD